MTIQTVEQLQCEKCDRFLADRFVEGTCPHPGCGYEDARGDQCDGCSRLVNAVDLINPRCNLCSTTPIKRNSEQFFFEMPKVKFFMEDIRGFSYKKNGNFILARRKVKQLDGRIVFEMVE